MLDKVPPNGPNLTYRNGEPQELTADVPLGSAPDGEGVAGPFLTAIVAIVSPNTFFNTAAVNSKYTSTYTTLSLCAQLRYPFAGLSDYAHDDFIIDWNPSHAPLDCPPTDSSSDTAPPLLRALMNENRATAALTLATFAAGNAILNAGPG